MYCKILKSVVWSIKFPSCNFVYIRLYRKNDSFQFPILKKKGDRTVKFLISVVLRLLKVEVEKK